MARPERLLAAVGIGFAGVLIWYVIVDVAWDLVPTIAPTGLIAQNVRAWVPSVTGFVWALILGYASVRLVSGLGLLPGVCVGLMLLLGILLPEFLGAYDVSSILEDPAQKIRAIVALPIAAVIGAFRARRS